MLLMHDRYKRPGTFDDYIPYRFDILPAATDCSFLSRATCKNLPGCIHCLDFKDEMRVLSTAVDDGDVRMDEWLSLAQSETDGVDRNLLAMMWAYESRRDSRLGRRLYASILPDRASISEGKATGRCQVGWEPLECDTWIKDSGTRLRPNGMQAVLNSVITIATMFLVCGLIFR